jgi:peptide/nickel transport system substrate-binding protein
LEEGVRALAALAALAIGTMLLAAGCGTSGDDGGTQAGGAQATETTAPAETSAAAETVQTGPPSGGVFRVGVESSFNFTNNFDPTGEYLLEAFGLYSNLLLRTLLGYEHVAGAPGNELVPDLATSLPDVSADGLRWTFTLKDGIRFGPPVSREITSRDVAYAFERIGTPTLAAQYGFYYDAIEGMGAFAAGDAQAISGIETPDERTIVFHLTRPTGDFGYRVAMPATAPVPEEIARCFTEAGEYGRFVIASGPYMIEGSDVLDATSCETLEPIAGFDPNASLSLVRNPEYDPATDDPAARQSLPDGFRLTVNTNVDAIFAGIERGELEAEWASVPPQVLREYSQNDELADRLKVNSADTVAYLTMNLTQPPFDDVHVRRAVNLVLDKEGLRRAWGGELKGEIATHVLPDALLAGRLEDYDPYATPAAAGDAEAARAELRLSRYDADQDGVCDAPACDDVLVLSAPAETPRAMAPVVKQSLAAIGIDIVLRESADPFAALGTVSKNIPASPLPSWGKDYADPSTFMVLFDGRSIIPTGNVNFSLVGLTPALAEKVGATGTVDGLPSVDADIDRCAALLGAERLDCYADLDRRLMETVVPWVPYLERSNVDVLGPAVVAWGYDQSTTVAAYAHVAVDVTKQQGP